MVGSPFPSFGFLLAASGLLGLAFFAGCSTPVPPEANLEISASPAPLVGRPEAEVESYFRRLSSPRSRTRRGVRKLTATDRGQTITALVSGGVCRSVRITGRLGALHFPRSPADLAELRDAYAGDHSWENVSAPSSEARNPERGHYRWINTAGTLEASSSWSYDSPERKAADYELTIRMAESGGS